VHLRTGEGGRGIVGPAGGRIQIRCQRPASGDVGFFVGIEPRVTRRVVLMLRRVEQGGLANLPEVGQAGGGSSGLKHATGAGEEKGRQNADNRDCCEQFNEGKAFSLVADWPRAIGEESRH